MSKAKTIEQDYVLVHLQPETQAALAKLPVDVVNGASMMFGIRHGEPLLLALDGLLRYAKAWEKYSGEKLCNEWVLSDGWLDALMGVHFLLNGNGAAALEHDRSTDSKDNGVLEAIYQAALKAGGFDDEGNRPKPAKQRPQPVEAA